MTSNTTRMMEKALLRIVVIVVVIAAGIGLRYLLASMKEPPRQTEITEPKLQVEVLGVYPEDVPVTITGLGDVKTLDVVNVSPQVIGNIVEIHPRLELGEVIPKGDVLFRIDPRDYDATRTQAHAQVERLRSGVALLKEQYKNDRHRVETIKRTWELAKIEFDRDKDLYEVHDVGNESMVHLSEMNFNKAKDAYETLSQLVELYPMRINEAESGLVAAEAQLDRASIALERTEVRALFDARVKMVKLEVGQYVAPGMPLLVLADDSLLEISVPLDSRDARSWLRFREGGSANGNVDGERLSWFGELEPVQCLVKWTEEAISASEEHVWHGVLDRVERFDQMTRTVTVAVRLGDEEIRRGQGLPLVDGMFCTVEIPGKTMKQVYRLPRWAVSFEGQVYLAEKTGGEYRIKRRDVEMARSQGEETFVSAGLEPGELVVTTRLVNPLPNSLLEFEEENAENAKAESPEADEAATNPST